MGRYPSFLVHFFVSVALYFVALYGSALRRSPVERCGALLGSPCAASVTGAAGGLLS